MIIFNIRRPNGYNGLQVFFFAALRHKLLYSIFRRLSKKLN